MDSYQDRRDLFSTDEIENYLNMKVGNIIPDRDNFLADNFATVKFCHSRKENFPALFSVVCQDFGTLFSSCASERTFLTINPIVKHYRSRLVSGFLEDILVVRSCSIMW